MTTAFFISAGHGRTDKGKIDPGARSLLTLRELGVRDDSNPLTEYEFTHTFTPQLFARLRELHRLPVWRVPDRVLSLNERILWVRNEAARLGADTVIALQVHANASVNPEARGMEIIVGPSAHGSIITACTRIVREASEILKTPNRGVKTDESIGRKIAWVRRLPYGVVWEVGFITNPEDAAMLVRLMMQTDATREISEIVSRALRDTYGLQNQRSHSP